jgi:hypothetical protein
VKDDLDQSPQSITGRSGRVRQFREGHHHDHQLPPHLTGIRVNTRALSEALTEAVAAAGHALSIHNTQPWRWQVTAEGLDLHLETSRLLDVTNPDTHLATLSC